MGKPVNPPSGEGIETINLKEALEERYLAYALSTIMHRALPDARDGLKPVHRRILHAMRLLRLDPGHGYKKCARIVGDVIGKYHPHGDQAAYDALVRMAQDFAQRYPLVDGQGNFGNIDGDNPAAQRYTEARMTEVARLLLEGIEEDAVDFRPNYDGQEEEPVVLPAAFPNLLANGSQGIAVGMATSIPPHNAAELCDAALYLISHPKATTEQLLNFVPGPDFPTGGVIVEPKASIAEAYRTGRGSFRVRARWAKEASGRGTWNIVVTEIPYGLPKARLIEKMAELLAERKLPLLADVRDEFDRGRAHRARAARPHRRSGRADGIAVQADRAREPHPAQRQRALGRQGAEGARPRRMPSRMARPSPRGADPALAPPPRRDRQAPRDPARPADRLSRPRPGHQDHPREGRAEAGADARLPASPRCRRTRSSTRGCAACASSRRWS